MRALIPALSVIGRRCQNIAKCAKVVAQTICFVSSGVSPMAGFTLERASTGGEQDFAIHRY
jgi:hypothetical protein